jgi:hypothetical protein
MKYLLVIIAATALLSSANATSRSADCCGGKCCKNHAPCCKK